VVCVREAQSLEDHLVGLVASIVDARPVVAVEAPPPDESLCLPLLISLQAETRDSQRHEELVLHGFLFHFLSVDVHQSEKVDQGQRIQSLVLNEAAKSIFEDLVEDLVLLGDLGGVRLHG
jgi:hypothetical protein